MKLAGKPAKSPISKMYDHLLKDLNKLGLADFYQIDSIQQRGSQYIFGLVAPLEGPEWAFQGLDARLSKLLFNLNNALIHLQEDGNEFVMPFVYMEIGKGGTPRYLSGFRNLHSFADVIKCFPEISRLSENAWTEGKLAKVIGFLAVTGCKDREDAYQAALGSDISSPAVGLEFLEGFPGWTTIFDKLNKFTAAHKIPGV